MMVEAYLNYAEPYYRFGNDASKTFGSIVSCVKPLLQLFGMLPVREFGPKKLARVREEFVNRGLCRRQCNARTSIIRRAFKWAVSEELIEPQVFHALTALPGLKYGRTSAPESVRVRPVTDETIAATLPFLPGPLADMVRLQWLSGMRPSEVCRVRWAEINCQKTPWTYRPRTHKTMCHDHERVVFLGPAARAILEKYRFREPQDAIFSPVDVVALRFKERRDQRKTPLSCGNSPGTHVVRSPKRKAGAYWITAAYGRAISCACHRAWPLPERLAPKIVRPCRGRKRAPRLETPAEWKARLSPQQRFEVGAWRRAHSWSPNQLRHSCGTKVRDVYGLDAAQVVLGHAHAKTTEIYAEKNEKRAAEIMEVLG